MIMQSLELENARAHYDPEQDIVYIAYNGILSSDVTLEVYAWLDELFAAIDINSLRGEIFDFRKVDEFDQSNIKTARRTSNRMNMKIDVSHVPVALIVGNPYHQETLLGGMRISPDHMRKRIVWSDAEAEEFFDEWHSVHDK